VFHLGSSLIRRGGSFERSDVLHQESLGESADIMRTTDTNMNSSVSYLVPSNCRRVEEVTGSRCIVPCQPEPEYSFHLAAVEESKQEEKCTSGARVDALPVRQGSAFSQQDNVFQADAPKSCMYSSRHAFDRVPYPLLSSARQNISPFGRISWTRS
jgi:hypothetical protein